MYHHLVLFVNRGSRDQVQIQSHQRESCPMTMREGTQRKDKRRRMKEKRHGMTKIGSKRLLLESNMQYLSLVKSVIIFLTHTNKHQF